MDTSRAHFLRRHRHLAITVAIAYWLFIFALTHIPLKRIVILPVTDKAPHVMAFFGLGIVLMLAAWALWPGRAVVALWVLAAGMIYGAVDELTQPLVNRSCDVMDWVADVAGLAMAVGLMSLLSILKRHGHARADA